MKKLLSSLVTVSLAAAVAASCENLGTNPVEDGVGTPDLSVVAKRSVHLKRALAYGSSSDPNRNYSVDVQERRIDDRKGSPGPTRRVLLSVIILDSGNWCSEIELELTKKQFHWSMNNASVNARTNCGPVKVSWQRTGPVTTSKYHYWVGPATCSPPEGQSSVHTVGSTNEAVAVASGTVGSVSVPLSGDNVLNYAAIHHGKDTQTFCASDPHE